MALERIPQDPDNPLGIVADPTAPVPFLGAPPMLAPPSAAGAPPALKPIGDDTPLGRFAQPILPPAPSPQVETFAQGDRNQRRTHDEQQLEKLNAPHLGEEGSSMPGFGGKLLHGLATAGNIAGNILEPGLMSHIKGTDAYNDATRRNVTADLDTVNKEDQTDAASDANIAKTKAETTAIPEKQNEKDQNDKSKLVASLAEHGFAPDEANPGQVRALRYEEMSPTQQAVTDLKGAQQEQAEATAALRAAQNDPTSPAFKLAQQRVATAQQNAQTALGRLGLSGQEFGFNQEKFYNPQPTAGERNKGDLAQSALDRIGEMRQIISKHPEYFGPGAGRATNAQQWLGSQDPDAQTYLSAAQYLADHSAGVFGGRGQYILSQLHSITDPHSNPAALNAALDEAERAAKGFSQAGTVHGKGGASKYSESGGGSVAPEGTRVQGADGKTQVKRGGKWVPE